MTKKIISGHAAATVEELRNALDSFMVSAGEHPSAVYVYVGGEAISMGLEEETLSDGSLVYNVRLFPRNQSPVREG